MTKEKYILTGKKFVSGNESVSYINLPVSDHSKEWDKKQEDGIVEYVQEIGHTDPLIEDVYKLFEDFTVRTLFGKTNLKILDVGCGIDPNYPKYARVFEKEMDETKNVYVGIDPISYEDEKRVYPFICGRIEDVPQILETKFDVFIFSTSLDHFENLKDVADSVRKIASPGAICIIWVGLHDTDLIAAQRGVELLPNLYQNLNLFAFAVKYISSCIFLLATFFYYRKKVKKLKNNIPLDGFHFYYFTKESIKKNLSFFGKIIDERKVTGTSGVFYVVKMD